jgi:sec-independent protein translocase protein TatA
MFALFGPIGIPELIIVLVIILLLFGASRLPEIGRGLGKGIKNFKESTTSSDTRRDDE